MRQKWVDITSLEDTPCVSVVPGGNMRRMSGLSVVSESGVSDVPKGLLTMALTLSYTRYPMGDQGCRGCRRRQ